KTWATRTALVFGTGAYAGATIAALHERGCTDIWVYSRSDRAASFADKRGAQAVSHGSLYSSMEKADIIIGCSGASS
ncbi:hypothetical protein ACXWO5_11225, partial [Streptococcus pyogenes]